MWQKYNGKTTHLITIPSYCNCMWGSAGRLTIDCQRMISPFPSRILFGIYNFIVDVPEEGPPRFVIRYNVIFHIVEETDGELGLRNFSRN